MEFFNKISIYKFDERNNKLRQIKVPINFASKEHYIAALSSIGIKKDDNTQTTTPVYFDLALPRMACSITGINYDSQRQLNKLNKIRLKNHKFTFMPVPYEMTIDLFIASKTIFDLFQIIEQIIPFFSPSISLDINLYPDLEPISIPIYLQSIALDIPEEFATEDLRILNATLSFSAKIYYFIPERISKEILEVDINYFDMDTLKKLEKYVIKAINPEPIYPPNERYKEPVKTEIEDGK
jgi:hypothetical protein